jgi:hypothetical protein
MKDITKVGKYCMDNLNAIGIYPHEVKEFKVNTRAKSYYGRVQKRKGEYTVIISKYLVDDNAPDKALEETMYHELLHCVDGCMNHGKKWLQLAELVSDCYSVNITRISDDIEKFGEEYANEVIAMRESERKTYTLKCADCGISFTKSGYRSPKWYAHPERFVCKCGSKNLVRVVQIKL